VDSEEEHNAPALIAWIFLDRSRHLKPFYPRFVDVGASLRTCRYREGGHSRAEERGYPTIGQRKARCFNYFVSVDRNRSSRDTSNIDDPASTDIHQHPNSLVCVVTVHERIGGPPRRQLIPPAGAVPVLQRYEIDVDQPSSPASEEFADLGIGSDDAVGQRPLSWGQRIEWKGTISLRLRHRRCQSKNEQRCNAHRSPHASPFATCGPEAQPAPDISCRSP
jgi:hypothetical protein